MVMQKPMKIRKRMIKVRDLIVLASISIIFSLISCNDTSDQMVNDTEPVKHFQVDELGFNESSFKESVIAVKGFVEDINYLNNRLTVVLSGEEPFNISVICDMQKDQTDILQKLELGEEVTIKGILKGSLKDIILLNCIIYNQTTND